MKPYLENAIAVVLIIVTLYTLFDPSAGASLAHIFLYMAAISALISGIYRINIPYTKESKEGKDIQEEYLHDYSKKSGWVNIAVGVLIFIAAYNIHMYIDNPLYLSIEDWYPVIGLLIIALFSWIALSYYKRKYRKSEEAGNKEETDEEKKAKTNRRINMVISALLAYTLYLIIIAAFPSMTKGIVLLSNNVSTSDIIFEYRTDTGNRIETIFVLYLKNEEELGFIRMEAKNANILPSLPFSRVYGNVLSNRYMIDIETGNTIMRWHNGAVSFLDENAKRDNIKVGFDYWHREYNPLSGRYYMNWRYFYMGIKHEFIELEGVEYKFIEYFDEIFDGIYVYFFTSHEWIEDVALFGGIRWQRW